MHSRDLDEATRRQIRLLGRYHRHSSVPLSVATGVFFLWMLAFGTMFERLRHHVPIDRARWPDVTGTSITESVAVLIGGYGAALLLSFGACWTLNRLMFRATLKGFQDSPRCPSCTYDLAALAGNRGDALRCPECGEVFRLREVRVRGLRLVRDAE
jgi:predicted RNA-binding Zn-ribbon protein involved in translation (DUF1610 family)